MSMIMGSSWFGCAGGYGRLAGKGPGQGRVPYMGAQVNGLVSTIGLYGFQCGEARSDFVRWGCGVGQVVAQGDEQPEGPE